MHVAEVIAGETRRETFPAAQAFAAHLKIHYGAATAAVIFYGSCLRHNTDVDLMLDFYVLVDSAAKALGNSVSALFARLLPPNVYYHELVFEGRVVRAKVAVITVSGFLRGLGPETFTSSLWARFAQPALILYSRNEELRRRLVNGLVAAVTTTLENVRPLMGDTFTARELWIRAFQETYAAELRPEREGKSAALVDGDLARYMAVTTAHSGPPDAGGLYHQAPSDHARHAADRAWRLRRIQGRTLNTLRLIKAAFTFKGGLDYAVWKIERHSGTKIELTEAERRHPLLTGARLLLKALQHGDLR